MVNSRSALLTAVLLLTLGSGCATFSGARPLDPGQTEIGVSMGGPVLNLGGPLPIPNLVLQGRHGIAKPLGRNLDIAYGLNLTGLAFGILQGHVGVNGMLIHQRKAAPALAVTYNQFFATNAPGLPSKPAGEPGGWAANQVEFNFSWLIKEQLIYTGLAQYTDFLNPQLALTPSVGVVLDTSPKKDGGLKVHFDFRWYAINQGNQFDAVPWIPRRVGAFGFGGGLSFVIPRKAKMVQAAPEEAPDAPAPRETPSEAAPPDEPTTEEPATEEPATEAAQETDAALATGAPAPAEPTPQGEPAAPETKEESP